MMKKITFALVLLSLSFLFSCDDDNERDPLVLSIDGDNLSAPFFDANVTQEAAVNFSSSLTASHTDKSIINIQCYLGTVPNSLVINIYGAGTSSTPGSLLHTQTVNTSNLRSNNAWYTFTLDDKISITGDDLWVGIAVQHNTRAGIIGCDPGPAVSGGDWYKRSASNFQTFRNFTGNSVDINWNIRAGMELD
ncbi:MAG: hypothetical protein ACPGJS_08275 [Flammeovirgaceae bacterium]